MKIGHEADVVGKLLQGTHPGKHHHHSLKSGGEPDGVAGVGSALQPVEDPLGRLRKICQGAAFDRFHDNDGLSVFAADLIAFPGFHLGVLIVQIVELNLNHLNLGIFRQNLIQNLGGVVEGNAQMADFSLRFQLQGCLIGPGLLVLLEALPALGVHQVKVKILYTAGLQLALEQGADILLLLKVVSGQLVGQDVAVPGVPGGQAFLQGQLAFSVDVSMGGVEIVEALFQKGIHHLFRLRNVHFLADHGKPHETKAKILPDIVKISVHLPSVSFS